MSTPKLLPTVSDCSSSPPTNSLPLSLADVVHTAASVSQYADMGCEKEFDCPSCTGHRAVVYSPGMAPVVDTIVKLELANPKDPTYPRFIAHIGDIRYASACTPDAKLLGVSTAQYERTPCPAG